MIFIISIFCKDFLNLNSKTNDLKIFKDMEKLKSKNLENINESEEKEKEDEKFKQKMDEMKKKKETEIKKMKETEMKKKKDDEIKKTRDEYDNKNIILNPSFEPPVSSLIKNNEDGVKELLDKLIEGQKNVEESIEKLKLLNEDYKRLGEKLKLNKEKNTPEDRLDFKIIEVEEKPKK